MENAPQYINYLVSLGLTEHEAIVYETLIQKGERSAGNLKRSIPHTISRPMLYFILDKLVNIGLIERIERKGKPAAFHAKHPNYLQNLVLKKEEEYILVKNSYEDFISKIVSDYNVKNNRPYVEFFDGLDGGLKVMNDTLTSTEPIYTYIDAEMLVKHVKEIDAEFSGKRRNKQLKKRILMVDSPLAREKAANNKDANTEIRIMSKNTVPNFSATTNIYDNKVAYITFKDLQIFSTLIHDKEIYRMNRFVFETLWEKAEVIIA